MQQLKTVLFYLHIKCHIPILVSRKFSKLFFAEMTTGISWSVSKFTAVTEVSESENKCNEHGKQNMTEDMLRTLLTVRTQFILNMHEIWITILFKKEQKWKA